MRTTVETTRDPISTPGGAGKTLPTHRGQVILASGIPQPIHALVDPIQNRTGGDHPYTGNNLEPNANLSSADLSGAQSLTIMSYATFSFGTTLPDGQTVAQHGFDAAALEVYLEADPVDAWEADNLTIVPEPTTLLLALLALVATPLRARCG